MRLALGRGQETLAERETRAGARVGAGSPDPAPEPDRRSPVSRRDGRPSVVGAAGSGDPRRARTFGRGCGGVRRPSPSARRLRLPEYTNARDRSLSPLAEVDPVDQVPTLWIRQPPSGPAKRVPRMGLVGKRNRRLWMSESPMLLQLDPLDHHFDPEAQAPTLWISAN